MQLQGLIYSIRQEIVANSTKIYLYFGFHYIYLYFSYQSREIFVDFISICNLHSYDGTCDHYQLDNAGKWMISILFSYVCSDQSLFSFKFKIDFLYLYVLCIYGLCSFKIYNLNCFQTIVFEKEQFAILLIVEAFSINLPLPA